MSKICGQYSFKRAAKALENQLATAPVIEGKLAQKKFCDTCTDEATAFRYGEGQWCDPCYDIYMDARQEYEEEELTRLMNGEIEPAENTGWIESQLEAERQMSRIRN